MAKPKQNKEKRSLHKERNLREPQQIISKPEIEVKSFETKDLKNRSLKKRVLIVCEGETEAAYFEGLCKVFNIREYFEITVLPKEKNDANFDEKYKGSSVKGLLYEAMKIQKNEKALYDEIWIVTDNDEENAYKLDDSSLDRIKNRIPISIYNQLTLNQYFDMNVRKEEKPQRERYFLNHADYELFLKEKILSNNELGYLNTIIENTTKKDDFTKLFENNRKIFFYNENAEFISTNSKGKTAYDEKYFDAKILNKIKVAYSCISFEYWILLHFEYSTKPFYNSREIIKYFDDKHYFNCVFKQKMGYEKGWHLYRLLNERNNTIKNFFNKYPIAFQNNIILYSNLQQHNFISKKFYELNPFTDIYQLTNYLLKQEFITIATNRDYIDFEQFTKINIFLENNFIRLNCNYIGTKSISKNDIRNCFFATDLDNRPLTIETNIEKPIYQPNEKLSIEISKPSSKPLFLYLTVNQKDTNNSLVWFVE